MHSFQDIQIQPKRSLELCWFVGRNRTIGSYMCYWEKLHDHPQVIEILCLVTSGVQPNKHIKTPKVSITSGRLPGFSQQCM